MTNNEVYEEFDLIKDQLFEVQSKIHRLIYNAILDNFEDPRPTLNLRVKGLVSLAYKCSHSKTEFKSIKEIDDLVGARLIHVLPSQQKKIVQLIGKHAVNPVFPRPSGNPTLYGH